MSKLIVFNFLTLNGFYKGPNGDTSWHTHAGKEENEYSEEALSHDNTLLFGRVTYEMMAGFWTTTNAIKHMPVVAKGMNESEKIVFSNTLQKADWNNTRIVNGNIVEEIVKMKRGNKNIAILGSGTIVTQCAEAGLVDEYQLLIDPLALGEGTPIFHGMKRVLELELTGSRVFNTGVVLLTYKPKSS